MGHEQNPFLRAPFTMAGCDDVPEKFAIVSERLLRHCVPERGKQPGNVIGRPVQGCGCRPGVPDPLERPDMRTDTVDISPLKGKIHVLILLAVSAAKDFLGDKGVYIVALISGLTDVDAITLSTARPAGTGTLSPPQAAGSILIAYISNLVFKLAMIGVIGTRQMFKWALLCFICLALPALLIFW
jgi:hypothetical protein